MAATSKLERIQCIAFAVKAAHIRDFRIPNKVTIRKSTEVERTMEAAVARKEISSINDIQALFTLSEEEFFYNLFNFYVTTKEIEFFGGKNKQMMVQVPVGTRLPHKMMEMIPRSLFSTTTTTAQLEKTLESLEKSLEKDEKLLEGYTSSGSEHSWNSNADAKQLAYKKIPETKKKIAEIQDKLRSHNTFFDIVPIDKSTEIAKFAKFLDTSFDSTEVVDPRGGYTAYLTASTATIKFHNAVQKVWKVATTLPRVIGPLGNLQDYVFLDQDSAFTLLVKDKALDAIKNSFNAPGLNSQIFSPVDMFIVRKSKRASIMKEITTKFITEKHLLYQYSKDSVKNPTSYKTVLQQYFDQGDLFGISIKLPELMGTQPVIKVVGEYKGNNTELSNNIDPFTKFLLKLEEDPKKMDEEINKLITINFGKFAIRSNLRSWAYPITFNYKDIFGKLAFDLEFTLFTWDKAGFNGQWTKKQAPGVFLPSNWTGGFGLTATNYIFNQYTEYKTSILPELQKRREKAFHDTIDMIRKGMDTQTKKDILEVPDIKTSYRSALAVVKSSQIIGRTGKDDSKELIEFFRRIDSDELRKLLIQKHRMAGNKKDTTYNKEITALFNNRGNRGDKESRGIQWYSVYRASVIENLLGDMNVEHGDWHRYVRDFENLPREIRKKAKTPIPNIEAHYVAAQCAWFLFHGGPSQHIKLKKKIFLSVFGVITKSGYKAFETFNDIKQQLRIKDIIKHKVGDTKLYTEFSHAPYIVLS